jgi:hypothetical protein
MNSYLARHGLRVWGGKVKRFARNDPPRYDVMNKNLVLGISKDRV